MKVKFEERTLNHDDNKRIDYKFHHHIKHTGGDHK